MRTAMIVVHIMTLTLTVMAAAMFVVSLWIKDYGVAALMAACVLFNLLTLRVQRDWDM